VVITAERSGIPCAGAARAEGFPTPSGALIAGCIFRRGHIQI